MLKYCTEITDITTKKNKVLTFKSKNNRKIHGIEYTYCDLFRKLF